MEYWKVKQLCDDIKRSCRPRNEINLASICNKHPNIYGDPASDERRAVQRKFDLLKRKTIQQYAHFLDKLELPHGAATLRELRRAAFNSVDSPPSTSTATGATTTNDNDSNETNNKTNDKTNDDTTGQLATIVANLSIVEPPAAATPVKTPTPPFVGGFLSPNRFLTPNNMLSPPPSVTASSEISDNSPGSRNSPHIIDVDTAHPERNREFFVQYVDNLEHNSHIRSVFHIRCTTAVQDCDLWEATIHGTESRKILVKGPSRDWWLTKAELYNTQFTCDATKNAHLATGLAIARHETRQWTYWLLVFPESVVLDNVLFSGDPTEIEVHVVGLSTTEESIPLQSCMVYWQVSMKFGGRRIKENTKSSVANLFGTPSVP
jgi:hypothetical protein